MSYIVPAIFSFFMILITAVFVYFVMKLRKSEEENIVGPSVGPSVPVPVPVPVETVDVIEDALTGGTETPTEPEGYRIRK